MDDSNVWDNMEINEYESNDDDVENAEAEQVWSIDEESDAASSALQDIEDSDDEEIFMDKDPTRKQLLRKQVRMKNKDKEHALELSKPPDVGEEDWYSDTDDETEPQCLSSYDKDDISNQMYYKDGVNMKTFKFHQGLRFVSPQQFREVLRDWAVRNWYDLNFVKNENARITAKCMDTNCTWRIHASPSQEGDSFQVKSLKGTHVCATQSDISIVKSSYLAKRVMGHIKQNPDISISSLQEVIKIKCSLEVGKYQAIKVKKHARRLLLGTTSEQYGRLWDYCAIVRASNPGSSLFLKKVDHSDPPMFERMYFCLTAMKNDFLASCRPFIGLDGCFLKTPYGGQLLVAVSRDDNDNMWPLALAMVPVENTINWKWFIKTLLEDIGGIRSLTFISDRQKGLVEALKEITPDFEHKYCLRHLYDNFKKKYKSPELRPLFWQAASTANKIEFENYMKKIEEYDPKVDPEVRTTVEWLRDIPSEYWSCAYFSCQSKTYSITNNICESFNIYIIQARDRPIISMWECIRKKLMMRIQEKLHGMEKYTSNICPNIHKKLHKEFEKQKDWFARLSEGNKYEVDQYLETYLVDLDNMTCTCGMFQLTGYPCSHGLTAIGVKRVNMEDYVHECYKKETYMRVYGNAIHGVPGLKHYIKTDYVPFIPPEVKKKVKGRPKKMRRKGVDESASSSSLRKGLLMICSNCLQKGHNRRSCKNSSDPNAEPYKPRPKKSKNSQSEVQVWTQDAPPCSYPKESIAD